MLMRIYMFSSLFKSKSYPTATPSARRKYCAGYGGNLMGGSVIVPVEFVMCHIINTGRRHLVPWLEFVQLC